MPTPQEWQAHIAIGIHYKARFKYLEEHVRNVLGGLLDDELTTIQLVEVLFPMRSARGSLEGTRQALFQHLMKAAKYGLADCCRKDMDATPRKRYGAVMYPWLWHAPKVTKRQPCPHCAGKGFI